MDIVLGVIVGLIVLTILVVLHEGGHFIMARKSGVKVNEFGIGFPPRLIAWVKQDGKWHRFKKQDWDKPQKGLIFSLNWLPIGGFCSMDGESDADTRKGTFGAATFWQKTKILFGGVLMNWLTAAVILTILSWVGMPHIIDNQFQIASDTFVTTHPVEIADVIEGSPASLSGLKTGDLISHASFTASDGAVENIEITDSEELINFNTTHAGETVSYTVLSPDQASPTTISVSLNDSDSEYLLGVTMHSTGQTTYRSTWSAPLVGIISTVQITGETFRGLGQMVGNLFSGIASQFSSDASTRTEGQIAIESARDSVTGPVGILGILFPAFVGSGAPSVALLAAIISISLACMNILPIPALDGGRWLLIALYKLRKKPLDTETESRIVSRAFLILIALAILITVLDIMRITK